MIAPQEMSMKDIGSFANEENGGNITTATQLGKVDPGGIFQKLDTFMKALSQTNLPCIGTLVLQRVIDFS